MLTGTEFATSRILDDTWIVVKTYGFLCDARDDLITASLHGATTGVMEENLVAVGRILGFTRLLD